MNGRGYGRLLLSAVAMTLLCRATSSPLDEGALQDLALWNTLQSREISGSNENRLNEIRELANLVREEAMRKGVEYADDPENPLQARLMEILQQHELQAKADKRASYMSLCHFKICNMGRKRTPLSLWPRA